MKYKGKIGKWWWFVLIALNGLLVWMPFNMDKANTNPILGIVVITIIDIWFLHMTFRNFVLLEETSMIIVLGLVKVKISYDEILFLRKTRSPVASMALSLDRIEISNKKTTVYIAVENKADFIRDVLAKNSKIKVEI